MTNQGSWCWQGLEPRLINVQENDIISLALSGGGTGTTELLTQYLTIQIIE